MSWLGLDNIHQIVLILKGMHGSSFSVGLIVFIFTLSLELILQLSLFFLILVGFSNREIDSLNVL